MRSSRKDRLIRAVMSSTSLFSPSSLFTYDSVFELPVANLNFRLLMSTKVQDTGSQGPACYNVKQLEILSDVLYNYYM